jgi:hypothetical protein
MMLPAEISMTKDPLLKSYCELYANDEALFFADFASAFGKVISILVLCFRSNQFLVIVDGAWC